MENIKSLPRVQKNIRTCLLGYLKKKTCEKKKRKKIDGVFKGDSSGYTYILSLFFFFWEKQTHTQGRVKGVLIQMYTTTPFKSHGNF